MVNYSYIVPRSEISYEDLGRLKTDAWNLLGASISSKGENPGNYIIRDILPQTDLGITSAANDSWVFSLTAGDNQVVSKKLDDDTHVVFIGVAYPDQSKVVSKITFARGSAEVLAIYQIQKLYAEREPVGYFKQPVAYSGGDTVTVRFTATADDSTEQLILLGYVAEPKGKHISGK